APAGMGAELRSAFVADGATWGALILVRRAGAPDFEDRDGELLSRASSLFARAVRRGLVAEATESAPAPAPEPPGVVELDAGNDPIRVSSTAEPLLAQLCGTTPDAVSRPAERVLAGLCGTTPEDGLRAPALHAVATATRASTQSLPTATV